MQLLRTTCTWQAVGIVNVESPWADCALLHNAIVAVTRTACSLFLLTNDGLFCRGGYGLTSSPPNRSGLTGLS